MQKINNNQEYDNNGYKPMGGIIDLAMVNSEAASASGAPDNSEAAKAQISHALRNKGRNPVLNEAPSLPTNLDPNELKEHSFCSINIKDGVCLSHGKFDFWKFIREKWSDEICESRWVDWVLEFQ